MKEELPRIRLHAGIWYVIAPSRYNAAFSREYVIPALNFVDRLNAYKGCKIQSWRPLREERQS